MQRVANPGASTLFASLYEGARLLFDEGAGKKNLHQQCEKIDPWYWNVEVTHHEHFRGEKCWKKGERGKREEERRGKGEKGREMRLLRISLTE